MVQLLVKFLKRLAVFIPGLVIAIFSWQYTLPFFNKHLPYLIALLLTYGVAAYVLIPAMIRLWRILLPPKHLPLYCVTPDGFASDPLNVGIICTRRELINVMEKAGWNMSDPTNFNSVIKQILSMLLNRRYLHSPMSYLYLFGRRQDISFSMPVRKTNFNRHHVRFWATTFDEKHPLSPHSIHWHNRKAHVFGDKLLWVGAASLDIGLVPIKHNWQLTHMVDPDTNKERELIIGGITETSQVKKVDEIKLGDPYKLVNRTWRGELHTDGIMKVIHLNG
ncbi:MAG TPA: LssY C-terminal domain-containing protein [Candidatus Saccharimonadales bacterium]|nr:LssY C-terminal domain-containing protein [Candidatus Saccharimonadales bacterium]